MQGCGKPSSGLQPFNAWRMRCMNLLVINTGSASLKYQRFRSRHLEPVEAGSVEWAGDPANRAGMVEELVGHCLGAGEDLDAIAHRVVHGGESFQAATLIDTEVLECLRATCALAPLHNPLAIETIEACRSAAPSLPQVAVFDTAFHRTLPPEAFLYALPWTDYETHRVRRYGFHGISHQSAVRRVAACLERPAKTLNLVSLHLGGGSSVTAIRAGQSVDTSMGMTPLEGLPMSTRCGDLDPAVVLRLQALHRLDAAALERRLNEESGMRGLGGTSDMRTLLARAANGDQRAFTALELYCYRARKYVGAYAAVLGSVDAVVFTGGIGENAPEVRAKICSGLESFELFLDARRNKAGVEDVAEIQAEESAVRIMVVRADEETEIGRQALELLAS